MNEKKKRKGEIREKNEKNIILFLL